MYHSLVRDKQRMSDKLYELMMKEYESMSKDDRIFAHIEEYCNQCVHYKDGECIPYDYFWKPVRSVCDFIPGRDICPKFKYKSVNL